MFWADSAFFSQNFQVPCAVVDEFGGNLGVGLARVEGAGVRARQRDDDAKDDRDCRGAGDECRGDRHAEGDPGLFIAACCIGELGKLIGALLSFASPALVCSCRVRQT